MFELYTLWDIGPVWKREPFLSLQTAMLAWKLLRAQGYVCFVVVS